MDCSQLSRRGARRWAGNVRWAVSQCTVLLFAAYAFYTFYVFVLGPGECHQMVQCVAMLSQLIAFANVDIAPGPLGTNV